MKEYILKFKPSERENVPDISETVFYKLNETVIKFFDEKIESELDKRSEKGAIDFKMFIFEQYDYVLINNKKDNKELQKKFFKLMNKYLKNETCDIGGNKYFIYLFTQINERPSELNYLAIIEIIKFLNDNIQRLKEIWEININHRQEKNLIKNSYDIFCYYSMYLNSNFKYYFNRPNNVNQNNINLYNNNSDYIYEFNKQKNNFMENTSKIISFYKKIEKEEINDNYKRYVQEKFFLFVIQMLNIIIRIKQISSLEEAESICQCCTSMLIKVTWPNAVETNLNLFWEIIKICCINSEGFGGSPNSVNFMYDEIFKNWKKYFDFEIYLENRYLSENKINKVLCYFMRLFTFCFNGNGGSDKTKGHQFLLFKNMIKLIEEDNYKIPLKLIEKINDPEVNLENKLCLINLIYDFLNWCYTQQNKIDFEILYLVLNQITNFLKMLYYLHKDADSIGVFLKEEKQIQKDYLQKNFLEINLENEEENLKRNKKYNLNGIFYNLTKGKYDKFIYIKDFKYLSEILITKSSSSSSQHSLLDVIAKVIHFFKSILKQNLNDKKNKSYYLDKISKILCKFFFIIFTYMKN